MTQCPCGAGDFDQCCAPLLRGERQAGTAEELMRSRYSAYAVGDADYVWRTWHPRTRPIAPTPPGDLVWTGLRVLSAEGGEADTSGQVRFVATYRDGARHGQLSELSRFEVRAGRWFYRDGDQD